MKKILSVILSLAMVVAFIPSGLFTVKAKAADGKATKIIIPSEIQSLAGLVTGIKEIAE